MKRIAQILIFAVYPIAGFSQSSGEPVAEFIIDANTTILDLQRIKAQYLSMGARFNLYGVTYGSDGKLESLDARICLANGNAKHYRNKIDASTALVLMHPSAREEIHFTEVPHQNKPASFIRNEDLPQTGFFSFEP
jgi:hypothetical protein